jgi:hypothetical protein
LSPSPNTPWTFNEEFPSSYVVLITTQLSANFTNPSIGKSILCSLSFFAVVREYNNTVDVLPL